MQEADRATEAYKAAAERLRAALALQEPPPPPPEPADASDSDDDDDAHERSAKGHGDGPGAEVPQMCSGLDVVVYRNMRAVVVEGEKDVANKSGWRMCGGTVSAALTQLYIPLAMRSV